MNKCMLFAVVFAVIALVGCANTNRVHLYTLEEKAGMTEDGVIATMTTPSELQELAKNAGKVAKPTGHVSYCNAGLLSQSARADALKAIDGVCGSKGQYTVLRAVPLLDAFEDFVGQPMAAQEFIEVERYKHGGMSSGMVSPVFWRETAIPLLLARQVET